MINNPNSIPVKDKDEDAPPSPKEFIKKKRQLSPSEFLKTRKNNQERVSPSEFLKQRKSEPKDDEGITAEDAEVAQSSQGEERSRNPLVNFGKTFWNVASKQIPSTIEAGVAAIGGEAPTRMDDPDVRFQPTGDRLSRNLMQQRIRNLPEDEREEFEENRDARNLQNRKDLLNNALKGFQDFQTSQKGAVTTTEDINDGIDLVNYVSNSVAQAAAQIPAALLTGGATSVGQEIGIIYMDQVQQIAEERDISPEEVIEKGLDERASAAAYGALAGSLDLLGAKAATKLLPMKDFRNQLAGRTMNFLRGAGIEGVTESSQSVIEQFGASQGAGTNVMESLTGVNLREAVEEGLAGAIGGGGINIATQVADAVKKKAITDGGDGTDFTEESVDVEQGVEDTSNTEQGTPNVEVEEGNESVTAEDVDVITKIFRGKDTRQNDFTGFYSPRKEEAEQYAKNTPSGEGQLIEANIKPEANVLTLVDYDNDGGSLNEEGLNEWKRITGRKYTEEGISTVLMGEDSEVKNKLKEAGIDVVAGNSIDGPAYFVINNEAIEVNSPDSPSQGDEATDVFRTSDERFRIETPNIEQGTPNVEGEGAGSAVRIVDERSGSELSRNSKNFNPAMAEWVTGDHRFVGLKDLTDGSASGDAVGRIGDELGPEANVQDWMEAVASEGSNPLEIVEALDEAQAMEQVDAESDAQNALTQFFDSLEGGRRIPRKDIERVKGSDFIKENRILYTVTTDEDTAADLPLMAETISEEAGQQYTEEDVIDALLDYKRGRSRFSDTKEKLRNRFMDVTGVSLTDNLLSEIRKRDTPDFTDESGQMYADRFTVPQKYVNDNDEIDYQALWEQDLSEDQNKDYWTGIINLSETEYGKLKNEVREQAENAGQESEVSGQEAADAQGEAEDAGGSGIDRPGAGAPNTEQGTPNVEGAITDAAVFADAQGAEGSQSNIESPEVEQLGNELEAAQKEYESAREAYNAKERELQATVDEDTENLFGERDVEAKPQGRMFDERADASRMRQALEPFRVRREKAKEEVRRLRKAIRGVESGELESTGNLAITDSGDEGKGPKPSKNDVLNAVEELPIIRRNVKKKGPKDTPVSRQKIADHVVNKLRIALGVGKSGKLRNNLGIYREGKPGKIIRLRVANDINTLAHEVGHGLHHIIFNGDTHPEFDSELLPLGEKTSRESYSKDQVRKEGQAEFFRYLVLDPQQARDLAPTYYEAWAKRLGQHPELQKYVDELYSLYDQYLSQDLVQQFESQIAYDDQSPTKRAREEETTMQYLYRKIFDDLIPLRRMQETLDQNEEQTTSDPDLYSRDAFRIAQSNKGIDGVLEGWIRYGVRNPDGAVVAKGIDPIYRDHGINTNAKKKQFDMYLLAQRGLELYEQQEAGERTLAEASDEQGGPLGFTREQAQAVVDNYGSPEFEAAANELYAWNDAVLDWLVGREYITNEQKTVMQSMNQKYVPMHRIMDFMENRAEGNKASLVDQPNLFQKIRGSGRRIKPAVETLILNTKKMINAAEQNYAAIQAFEKIKESEAGGEYADKVMRPLRPVKSDLESIRATLEHAGLEQEVLNVLDLKQVFTLWRPAQHNSQQGEVLVRRNGESHIWQVHDETLYDALTQLNPHTTNLLTRILTIPRNVFRHGVVMSLNFITGNTSRDQFVGHLNSRYDYATVHLNPFKKGFGSSDFFKGMASIITRDENYRLWLQSKGSISGIVDQNRNTISRTVKQLGESKPKRIIKNVLYPARWLEAIETFSSVFENTTRVGEFRRGLEVEGSMRGLEPGDPGYEEVLMRAGISSREISGDFARGGEWSKMVGRFKAFYNAGMQGSLSLAQAIKRDPVGFFTRGILTMTIPTLVLNELNKGNPDWEEREEERELYWLYPIGDPKTTTNWLRIRKPWESGQFFGSVLPKSIESGIRQEAPEGMAEDLFEGLNLSKIIMSIMPNTLLPMIEVTASEQGYQYFWQQSIDPYFDTELEPWLRYDGRNSELEKMMGKTLNYSPRKIRHLIRGYSGTLGIEMSELTSEYILENLKGLDRPPSPDRGPGSKPGLKPFFSPDLSAGRAESVQQFYDALEQSRTASRSLKAITDPEERTEYINQNRTKIKLLSDFNEIRNRMSEIRDEIALIYESHVYTPEAKRDMLKDKNEEIIRIAKIGVRIWDRYEE